MVPKKWEFNSYIFNKINLVIPKSISRVVIVLKGIVVYRWNWLYYFSWRFEVHESDHSAAVGLLLVDYDVIAVPPNVIAISTQPYSNIFLSKWQILLPISFLFVCFMSFFLVFRCFKIFLHIHILIQLFETGNWLTRLFPYINIYYEKLDMNIYIYKSYAFNIDFQILL